MVGYTKIYHNGIVSKRLKMPDSVSQALFQKNNYAPGNFSVPLMIEVGETLEKKACKTLLEMENLQFLNRLWSDLSNEEKSSDRLSNFLAFPNIKDTSLIQWKISNELKKLLCSNAKDLHELFLCISNDNLHESVTNALYESYQSSIKEEQFYDPSDDFILCRTFNDSKLLISALALDLQVKSTLFHPLPLEDALWFIDLLKTHYDQNDIFRLLTEQSEKKYDIWHNILNLVLIADKSFVQNTYKQTKCDIDLIHQELQRCAGQCYF